MHRLFVLAALLGAAIIGQQPSEPARADQPEKSHAAAVEVLFNEAADGLCICVPFAEPIDKTSSKQMILDGYRKLIERYSGTGITHLLLNTNYQRACYPSKAWDSYWDIDGPEANLNGWPRTMWRIHQAGVDPYAVCIELCRDHGISPWTSMRMNDTHYLQDPHKPNRFWKEHPEYRTSPGAGFNFAIEAVRRHHLALIEEILQRYDVDGLELDWMRGYPDFPGGGSGEEGQVLTRFMRKVDRLAVQASQRRGHSVKIAARVPAVPQVAHALGLHGDAWVREGLVDTLIVSSTWMPADRDTPLETWRDLIGSIEHDYKLAASMGLWVRCVPGGPLMRNDLESARGFTTSMIDRGADQIYMFNHFNPKDFLCEVELSDGSTSQIDIFRQLVTESAHFDMAMASPRRHILTHHDTAAPGISNPRPLPAGLEKGETGAFRIYSGPKPRTGSVVIRVGLDESDDLWQAKLTARLNSVECPSIEDLNQPGEYVPHDGKGFHYAWSVAQVAPRVAQFNVPLAAVEGGYNRVELTLRDGAK
ncbi:MAG: hypothetical protein ACC645_24485, partial [Pirellulales bacterium]